MHEHMSTPAENTRFRQQRKTSGSSVDIGKQTSIDPSKQSTKEKFNNKEVSSVDRVVKKKSIYRSLDGKQDALIKKWLASSQEFETDKDKRSDSINYNWADAVLEDVLMPSSQTNSQASSEVSFNVGRRDRGFLQQQRIKGGMKSNSVTSLKSLTTTMRESKVKQKMERMASKLQHQENSQILEDTWKKIDFEHDEDSQAGSHAELNRPKRMRSAWSDQTIQLTHSTESVEQLDTVNHGNNKTTTPYQSVEQAGSSRETFVSQEVVHENEDDPPQNPVDQNLREKSAEQNVQHLDDNVHSAKSGQDILDSFKKKLDDGDNQVFYEMFELMITKMSSIEEPLVKVKQEQKSMNQKVVSLETAMAYYDQSIGEIDQDIAEVSDMNIKLVQATIKCDENVGNLSRRIKGISKAVNKGNFICYGLKIPDGKTAKSTMQKFIDETLSLKDKCPVKTAYMIGKRTNSPIVFQLEDPNDVGPLFKKMGDIKPKNRKDGKISIRDYLDEEDRDNKMRHQDLIADNRSYQYHTNVQ